VLAEEIKNYGQLIKKKPKTRTEIIKHTKNGELIKRTQILPKAPQRL